MFLSLKEINTQKKYELLINQRGMASSSFDAISTREGACYWKSLPASSLTPLLCRITHHCWSQLYCQWKWDKTVFSSWEYSWTLMKHDLEPYSYGICESNLTPCKPELNLLIFLKKIYFRYYFSLLFQPAQLSEKGRSLLWLAHPKGNCLPDSKKDSICGNCMTWKDSNLSVFLVN